MMPDKKYKVLIVDDEFRIGLLIKKLIKWEEIGLECVDVVDNGETAYNLIISKDPDIVITDIRMPKINGLELIRMTKEINQKVKFIVISGYKEFEYAHKALEFQVNNYLLKPVNEDELNKVLMKVYSEIDSQDAKKHEEEQLKKAVIVSEQIIKSNLLNNIIEQGDCPSVEEIREGYNLSLNAPAFRGIDIKLDYYDYMNIDERQDRMTIEKVISTIESNFKENVREHLVCEKDGLNIYCLINYDLADSKKIKNIINNILSELQEYFLGFEQYEATIGIGSEKTEFREIRYSIQEAFKAVQNRVKVGTGRLIYAEALQLDKPVDVKKYVDTHNKTFLSSIESYSKESFERSINQIYSEILFRENIDFSCFYDIAMELIKQFFENIGVKSSEGEQLMEFLQNACYHCNTVGKLKDLLKEQLGEYLQLCLKQLETESTKPIRQAKQYIDSHYREKIVLEDIAGIVDLNPVYFSVLFKKETGVNFSDYLVNARIEAAKKMLRESNETIAAIADEVGYKDSRYFSQIFTKTVGIKPALYRKLYS